MLLGIDYGDANIGLAFGREGLTTPLKVISGKNTQVAIADIVRISFENKINRIIMGLPLTFDGKETPQSIKIRRFAKTLKIYLKKPLNFVNEVSTTEEAVSEMVRTAHPRKSRRHPDHFSASLILKRFYDEQEINKN